MTKEDFLKCIKNLDPKSRAEVVEGITAPPAMKSLAKKDASGDAPGTNRLLGAKMAQAAAGKNEAKSVGQEMAKREGDDTAKQDAGDDDDDDDDDDDERDRGRDGRPRVQTKTSKNSLKKMDSPSSEIGESAVERKRREEALRGVDEVLPGQRSRGRGLERIDTSGGGGGGVRSKDGSGSESGSQEESAAEKRRRHAALQGSRQSQDSGRGRSAGGYGIGEGDGDREEDSDEDGTPRVPPAVASRSRGIRFAQSPVRRGRGTD